MATTINSARIIRTAPDDPSSKAALQAEQRLFAYYRLDVRTRYIDLKEPNIRVRALEVGDGPPVLAVPGGNGEAFAWVPLMAQLKGWRFITFDRPGAGLSDYVDPQQINFRRLALNTLCSVLDAFEIKTIPVLGNSMGGLWSFWLALDQPERVSKMVQLGYPIILEGAAPLPMRLMAVPVLNRFLVSLSVPKTLDKSLDGLRRIGSSPEQIRALPKEFGEADYYFRHLPAFQDSWRTLQQRAVTLSGPKRDLLLTETELRKVQQPVLFIWGDKDFGSLDIGRRAAGIAPHAKLIELHTGHLPWVDEPAECGLIVREFLSGTG